SGELPVGWDDDWLLVPVENAESGLFPFDLGEEAEFEDQGLDSLAPKSDLWSGVRHPRIVSGRWPGAPRNRAGSPVPPPDALAFYLPFHRFYPTWWGIYLLHEGVDALARDICRRADGTIQLAECSQVARIFLYGHEHFHHCVETLAMRLEVTHRKALYIT